MSATRDKSQKVAFVYTNLYQLYRKGKDAALNAEVPAAQVPGLTTSRVIKAADAHAHTKKSDAPAISNPEEFVRPFSVTNLDIRPFQPVEFISKRVEKSHTALQAVQNPTINSLKDNLKSLNDLHERLQFMLKELEDLIKE